MGNGGLWQVSEAPKYFGGGVKKRTKFSLPPPHSHHTRWSRNVGPQRCETVDNQRK